RELWGGDGAVGGDGAIEDRGEHEAHDQKTDDGNEEQVSQAEIPLRHVAPPRRALVDPSFACRCGRAVPSRIAKIAGAGDGVRAFAGDVAWVLRAGSLSVSLSWRAFGW